MVTGEPVDVSSRSHGLCVAGELDSGPRELLPREYIGCLQGSPTSKIDGGGAQHISWDCPHQ